MTLLQSRREFAATLSLAGAAALIGSAPALADEGTPETSSVRLPRWVDSSYCWAGLYVAGELLRAEGFTDVRYLEADSKVDQSVWIARGETDFSVNYVPRHVASIEAGVPIKVLTGLHSGCQELIAADESIRNITDLRGKRVGVGRLDSTAHTMLTLMAAYVGLDPVNDIQWVLTKEATPKELFVDGKIDAYLAGQPDGQKLRAEKIGHTIFNTAVDRPWSQYFCCMVSGRAEYVNTYPVATKRVLRAILKSADLCVSDPQWVAQQLVERGFVTQYDYTRQMLNEIRYDRWRDFDAEDSLRFYALRMQDTGMIKSSPQKIIADGTDWRFLNELKRELKT
jgi:NitT/TauT family transport system substrate-binding protein